MRCKSCGCVGIYMLRRSIGVRGLLLIRMAWRYGDMWLGVGVLVIFSLVYIDLGIMVSTPLVLGWGPNIYYVYVAWC